MAVLLILTFSGALFLYWFRYCCLLILQTRSSQASVEFQHAQSLGLSYPDVRALLEQPQLNTEMLDRVNSRLIGDFAVLGPLLASAPRGVDPMMRWMLVLDYWLLRLSYRSTRRWSRKRAQAALREISQILGFFTATIGQPPLSRAAV